VSFSIVSYDVIDEYQLYQCLIVNCTQIISLRGKVLLKGRRIVEATDDDDSDCDEADDELTELQSNWTEKTTATVSIYQTEYHFAFVEFAQLNCVLLARLDRRKQQIR
jgi:hypothetical protein